MAHRQQATRQQPELRRAVAFLGARPGAGAFKALLLRFQAGKLSTFDTYSVLDQIRMGRLPSRRIDDLIARQQLAAVEVGAPDDPEKPAIWRISCGVCRTPSRGRCGRSTGR